jgi:hypothetical protein
MNDAGEQLSPEERFLADFMADEPLLSLDRPEPDSAVLQQLREEREREQLEMAGAVRTRLAVWSCLLAVASGLGAVIAMVSSMAMREHYRWVLYALQGVLLLASLSCASAALLKKGTAAYATEIALVGVVLWLCALGITLSGMNQRYRAGESERSSPDKRRSTDYARPRGMRRR